MKKPVLVILLVVLLGIFCFSGYQIYAYISDGIRSNEQYDQLADLVNQNTHPTETTPPSPTEDPAPQPESSQPTDPTSIEEYQAVYNLNSDTVGWIRIEGTKINYPVMQTPDNPDFYLKRDFNKEKSDWGAIYVREQCDVNKPSDNVTIYGHCMRDGSMFAQLHEYRDKTFWEEHKLIYFDTLEEYHVYEIFGVFVTSANVGEGFSYHQMVDAKDEGDFDNFISNIRKLSLYDTGIVPKYGDKVICLSTSEYSMDNGRLVVAARRVF